MSRAVAALLGCAAVLWGCTRVPVRPADAAPDIAWAAGRPLRWKDFAGAVDPQAPPERVALTAASIRWGYDYRLERGDGGCAYRITGARAQAVFNPADSWVKPDHRNEAVLAHEQGHFDLAQIHTLILRERLAQLVGTGGACRGNTLEQASESAKRSAAARVQRLFDEVWQRLLSAQAAYDAATRHGIAVDAQQRWTRRIRHGLERGGWDALL